MPQWGSVPCPACSGCSGDGCQCHMAIHMTPWKSRPHCTDTPLMHARMHDAQPSCALTHWTHAEMC
eukprot:1245901-Alexandrium_andersonii.AAC.2